jgi:hypothetical protein
MASSRPADWLGSPASVPHEVLDRGLDRSRLPVGNPSLIRLAHRLRAGLAIVVTAVGQSNTVDAGGCFGNGCDRTGYNGNVHGWGHDFMLLLNQTWPHPRHAFFNRAYGASSPKAIATCLGGHMAEATDVLLVDFNTMNWRPEEQERLARTAALLPHPPLVVFVGFPNWCGSERLRVNRRENETASEASHRTRDMAYLLCRQRLAAGVFTDRDIVGESLARVASHYSQVYLSLHDILAPLILAHNPHLYPLSRFTVDGAHGRFSGSDRRSAYYDVVAAALYHLLYRAIRESGSARASPRTFAPTPSIVPSPLMQGTGHHFMLSCHEWLHPNLQPPQVLSNRSGVGGGAGWVVSEYTQQTPPRRKPALLSLSPLDEVELGLDTAGVVDADATERGGPGQAAAPASPASPQTDPPLHPRGFCLGLTYLRSYEGMGAISVTCSGACTCDGARIDALSPDSRASLFHTYELRATLVASPADGAPEHRQRGSNHLTSRAGRTPAEGPQAERCTLRLLNLGRPAQGTATGQGSDSNSVRAQFRLSGLYVRHQLPDCEQDVGALRAEDGWWRAAINRVPQRNGLEPARRR